MHDELPLSGVRVLDLSTIIAAPLAATLLADFGADVVKVEAPGTGDDVRRFSPKVDGEALMWRVSARNKRSLTLDLHRPEAAGVVYRLVEHFDVVVTNFRLSTLQQWRLDYPELRQRRPDLVMLHLTAFGRTGPWRDKPGFARVVEAFAGLPHITGYPDGPPLYNGYPIADAVGGIYGAFALMLAIRHRDRTGEGQLVDLGLYEPMVRLIEDMYTAYDVTGVVKGRTGNDQVHSCPNNVFPTRDGQWVVIAATTANMWERLKKMLGRSDLDRYETTADRVADRAFIDGCVSEFTLRHTRAELVELFERYELAGSAIMSARELVEHEQVRARGNFTRYHDPVLGRDIAIQAPVPRMSRSAGSIRSAAPRLGEHSDEVLREIGLDAPAIEDLHRRGIT